MIKFTSYLLATLFVIGSLEAQQIKFAEAEPAPSFPGALFGAMDFADVDGDGDQDIFICGREDGWTSLSVGLLYLNDGTGNFIEDSTNLFPKTQLSGALFQDLDGDGDEDFLYGGRGDFSEKIGHYYVNDGNGGFTLSTNLPLEPCEKCGFQAGDIDGDGDVDVFQFGERGPLGSNEPFVKLLRNDGFGMFAEIATPQFDTFTTITLVDLEGDGDLDVLGRTAMQNEPSSYTFFENLGNGAFEFLSTPGISALNSDAHAMGDLDGDGDADVFITGMDESNVPTSLLYLNEGAGEFSLFPGSDVFFDVFVGSNSLVDFDNDGDLDILMSGSGQGGLSGMIVSNIYENLGNNNYVQADSLTGSYISTNAIGDINGDGLLDLVLSGTTVGTPSFKTWVYLNQTTVSSVADQAPTLNIELYPNPTSGELTIIANESDELLVELYTATGQHIWSQRIQGQGASTLFINQATGLYLLTVYAEGKRTTKRVSVVR